MKAPYVFSILRYIHDPLSQEFINVGVVVYSQQERFLQAKCSDKYGRISKMFEGIDGTRFRQLTKHIENRISELSEQLRSELPFSQISSFDSLLSKVVPPDDGSLQFAPAGAGVTENLTGVVDELFQRYVGKYSETSERSRKSDSEVWKPFKEALDKKQVSSKLTEKSIVTSNFEWKFEHAAKNGIWHVCQTISFDLQEGKSIVDKALHWPGRITELNQSSEKFKVNFLLGAPQDKELLPNFNRAKQILKGIQAEIFEEKDADAFATKLQLALADHVE